MKVKSQRTFWLALVVCALPAIIGCGGKQDATTSDIGSAKTPEQATTNHLKDPNVSSYEKEQIQKHMGGSGAPSSTGSGQ